MGAVTPAGDAGGGDPPPPVAGALGVWRRLLDGVETVFAAAGAIAVAAMSGYIVLGVFIRNVLNLSLNDEAVVVGELMIAALVLPLGKVAAEGGFITVDVLTRRFAERHAIALNTLAALVGLVVAGAMFHAGWKTLHEVLVSGSYYFGTLQLPEWPGKTMFLIGYALFTLRLLDLLVIDPVIRLKRERTA